LNKITKPTSYPLPLIDDILTPLGSSKYFTTLDVRRFWHIPVHESDKEKTDFTTFKGLYEYNVVPFGLVAAPGVFQELMSHVLQGLEAFAVSYLDAILIFSKSLNEHFSHIQTVFSKLKGHKLKLKLKNMQFYSATNKVPWFYCIKPDPEKVKAIRSVPVPKCVKDPYLVLLVFIEDFALNILKLLNLKLILLENVFCLNGQKNVKKV
jgi:hypothetical protein